MKWDGVVDLTTKLVLNARARGLKIGPDAPVTVGKPLLKRRLVAKAAPAPKG